METSSNDIKGFSEVMDEKRETWKTGKDLPPWLLDKDKRCMRRLVYLIHPVRKATQEQDILVKCYAEYLEKQGYLVFVPARDNPFEGRDRTGRNICLVNRAGTLKCDETHVIWSGDSTGSHFDLGMAFAFCKPLTIVHQEDTGGVQSFESMMGDWPWGLWISRPLGQKPWFETKILQYPTLKAAIWQF